MEREREREREKESPKKENKSLLPPFSVHGISSSHLLPPLPVMKCVPLPYRMGGPSHALSQGGSNLFSPVPPLFSLWDFTPAIRSAVLSALGKKEGRENKDPPPGSKFSPSKTVLLRRRRGKEFLSLFPFWAGEGSRGKEEEEEEGEKEGHTNLIFINFTLWERGGREGRFALSPPFPSLRLAGRAETGREGCIKGVGGKEGKKVQRL